MTEQQEEFSPEHLKPLLAKIDPREIAAQGRGATPLEVHCAMRSDLRPGGRFPDLTLADHRGEPVTLSKLANGFPLILSFYRGYW